MRKLLRRNVEPQLEQSLLFLIAILFMIDFKKCWQHLKKTPIIWWNIDDMFFIWEHDKEPLKVFSCRVNIFHHAVKSTAE